MQNDLVERFSIVEKFLAEKELNHIELKCFFNSVILNHVEEDGWHFQLMDPNSFFQCFFDFEPKVISSWSEDVVTGTYIATKNVKRQLDRYYKSMIKKNIRLEHHKNFIHNMILRFFK